MMKSNQMVAFKQKKGELKLPWLSMVVGDTSINEGSHLSFTKASQFFKLTLDKGERIHRFLLKETAPVAWPHVMHPVSRANVLTAYQSPRSDLN